MTGDRRTHRRARRTIGSLDEESRRRMRTLLTSSRLVISPTDDAIALVHARLAPTAVPLAVSCPDHTEIDRTLTIAESLAAEGYEVTAHLVARKVRSGDHLDEILQRLAARRIRRVLVVRGTGAAHGRYPRSRHLLEAMHEHPSRPADIGIAGSPVDVGVERNQTAQDFIERARLATFVSTEATADPDILVAWAAGMRVRGLDVPIEVGMAGVVPRDRMSDDPSLAPARPVRRAGSGWHDPTPFLVQLAALPPIERLGLTGLRLETANEIEANAAWRQATYDLVHRARSN